MQAEDVANDRQPDARPFVIAARACVHLVEPLENLPEGVLRDSAARIGDLDLEEPLRSLARRQGDAAAVPVELDGVGQ